MLPFPYVNFFLMIFSTWIAFDKRFRTGDAKRNWWIYRLNLFAAGFNAGAILLWLFF